MLQELRAVLSEKRHAAGANYSHVAAIIDQDANSVRKFERGESGPKFSRVDDWVAAYAEVCGCDPAEIWREVLRRAIGADSGEPGGEKSQRGRR